MSRTIDSDLDALLTGPAYGIHARVFVADESEALADHTDALRAWVLESGVDELVDKLTLTFERGTGSGSYEPLMTASPPVKIGREVVFEVACTPTNAAPDSGDWIEVFRGMVRKTTSTTGAVQVICQDQGGVLADSWVKSETEYGTESGQDLEDVMQEILDDNSTGVTLYVPSATGAVVTTYTQQREPILTALRTLAEAIGWTVRYRWDSGTSAFRLTLYEPDRDKTTADFQMSPSRYIRVTELDQDIQHVRNEVAVEYTDENGDRQTVTAIDSDSVAEYGGPEGLSRFMVIGEDTESLVNNPTLAASLAAAAVSDLAEPDATHGVEDLLLPHLEVGDLIGFDANNVHYSAPQKLALMAIRHEGTAAGKGRTSLKCRGKPSAGVLMWRRRAKASRVNAAIIRTRGEKNEPSGTIAATVDKVGVVRFTFSGNAKAVSFAWKASLEEAPSDPSGATVIDARSGEVEAALTLPNDEAVGYVAGWFYPEADAGGEPGARVLAVVQTSTDDDTATYPIDPEHPLADGEFVSTLRDVTRRAADVVSIAQSFVFSANTATGDMGTEISRILTQSIFDATGTVEFFNTQAATLREIAFGSNVRDALGRQTSRMFAKADSGDADDARGILYNSGSVTLESLKPAESGAEQTAGKSLAVLTNRTATNIAFADAATVESLKPGEAGANVTESRTSNNTSNVSSYSASTVADGTQRSTTGLKETSGEVQDKKVKDSALDDVIFGSAAIVDRVFAAEVFSNTVFAKVMAADVVLFQTAAGTSVNATEVLTENLAAWSAVLGEIVGGILLNTFSWNDPTVAIRISNDFSIPGSVDRYIDLGGGTGNFIHHPALTLEDDGDASFSGDLSAAGGTFAGDVLIDNGGGKISFRDGGEEFASLRALPDGAVVIDVGDEALNITEEISEFTMPVALSAGISIGDLGAVRTILVGAENSGGSGFRMLRVSN